MREEYEIKSLLIALKLKRGKEKKNKELNTSIKLLEWILNEEQINLVEI